MKTTRIEEHTGEWLEKCFSTTPEHLELKTSVTERVARIVEEVAELTQAEGVTRDEMVALIDAVYERPVGEPEDELGGVMICLAAYAYIRKFSLYRAWLSEFVRINKPEKIAKIRARQDTKIHVVR